MTKEISETYQKEQSEVAIFWDEFAKHLPKSIEREALGDEKICNAFRAVYPEITTHLRTSWLRSEIEKLEGMKKSLVDEYDTFTDRQIGFNTALTSIITRYKEELLELEKHNERALNCWNK